MRIMTTAIALIAFAGLTACTDPSVSGPLLIGGAQTVDTAEETDSGLEDTADTGEVTDTGEVEDTGSEKEHVDEDLDGDGFTGANDCDESNPDVHAYADEVCSDGVDNDCDGEIDEDEDTADCDGDGFSVEEGDCDDSDADIYPYAEDSDPHDSVNENCGYEEEAEEDTADTGEVSEETLSATMSGAYLSVEKVVDSTDFYDTSDSWDDEDGDGTTVESLTVTVEVDASSCGVRFNGNDNSGSYLCELSEGSPVVNSSYSISIEHAGVSYNQGHLKAIALDGGASCYLQILADSACDL